MFLDKCMSSVRYRCLQVFLLSALFVCAPTQVVGKCADGTSFTAVATGASPAIGASNVKIDCAMNPPNQTQCYWNWQYKVNNMWSVVSSNSTGTETGYYFLPTGSLLISSVKQAHGTLYMCKNPSVNLGSSVPVALYLQAQLSNVGTKDVCVEIGSNATFSFLAAGYPTPSVALYRQVQSTWNVVTDRRFVLNQSSLSIISAQLSDSGVYAVRANVSIISSFAELPFTITVSGNGAPRPALLPNASTIVARESESLSIQCYIQASAFRGVGCTGYPAPQPTIIRWMKNGVAIQDNKPMLYTTTNFSAGVSILRSDYLLSELSGQYTCESSNAQGFGVVSTTLQVYKVCEINPCLNGGTCIPNKSGDVLCLCSEQNTGDYCQNFIIKSVHLGEFQIGTVLKWELNGSRMESKQLKISNASGDLFQISVQYDIKSVSFSSPSRDRWSYEEQTADFPFASPDASIIVVMEEGGFAISCNGTSPAYLYAYRGVASGSIMVSITSGTVAIGKKLLIPSYQPGAVIYIQGVAPASGDFAIQLYPADPQMLMAPSSTDIALSVKPLFSESSVVLNSLIAGRWGQAQKEKGFPLEASKPFILAITWQLYGFEVAINGVHFATYSHRLPFAMSTTVMTSSLDYVYRIRLY